MEGGLKNTAMKGDRKANMERKEEEARKNREAEKEKKIAEDKEKAAKENLRLEKEKAAQAAVEEKKIPVPKEQVDMKDTVEAASKDEETLILETAADDTLVMEIEQVGVGWLLSL